MADRNFRLVDIQPNKTIFEVGKGILLGSRLELAIFFR